MGIVATAPIAAAPKEMLANPKGGLPRIEPMQPLRAPPSKAIRAAGTCADNWQHKCEHSNVANGGCHVNVVGKCASGAAAVPNPKPRHQKLGVIIISVAGGIFVLAIVVALCQNYVQARKQKKASKRGYVIYNKLGPVPLTPVQQAGNTAGHNVL